MLVLTTACAAASDRQPSTDSVSSLIGTWRVTTHIVKVGPDSAASRPTRGYLVYDPTGHVFVQVLDRDSADSLSLRHWSQVPDTLLKKLIGGFQAYYGTYAADTVAGLVTHRIEGEFLPRGRNRLEIATPYRLRGDTLRLGTDSTERWVLVRIPK